MKTDDIIKKFVDGLQNCRISYNQIDKIEICIQRNGDEIEILEWNHKATNHIEETEN